MANLPSYPLVHVVTSSQSLMEKLCKAFEKNAYSCDCSMSLQQFLSKLKTTHHNVNCLVLEKQEISDVLIEELYDHSIVLPCVIIDNELGAESLNSRLEQSWMLNTHVSRRQPIYHRAEVHLEIHEIRAIIESVSQAMDKFASIYSATVNSSDALSSSKIRALKEHGKDSDKFLSNSLAEHSDYSNLFYRRIKSQFFSNLDAEEQQTFLENFRLDYQAILVNYFKATETASRRIDLIVNQAFFANFSIVRIVQIHLDLIDSIERQLKLEGYREDIVVDYRLPLLEVLVHLTEMYRRSCAS